MVRVGDRVRVRVRVGVRVRVRVTYVPSPLGNLREEESAESSLLDEASEGSEEERDEQHLNRR